MGIGTLRRHYLEAPKEEPKKEVEEVEEVEEVSEYDSMTVTQLRAIAEEEKAIAEEEKKRKKSK